MKKNLSRGMAVMTATVLILTGCGNAVPDLSPEQEQVIGDYAAGLLLKYDAAHRSRLVDLSLVETEEAQTQESQENPLQEEPSSQPSQKEPPVIVGEDHTLAAPDITIEQAFGLPEGVALVYQGEKVVGSYPEPVDGAEFYSVDATSGKQLLVLLFRLENQSGQTCSIDIFGQQPSIQIYVNDTEHCNTLITLLPDDFATYIGEVPAGSGKDVVLLAETTVTNAEAISSLKLHINCNGQNIALQLK